MITEAEIVERYCEEYQVQEKHFYLYNYDKTLSFAFYKLRVSWHELIKSVKEVFK